MNGIGTDENPDQTPDSTPGAPGFSSKFKTIFSDTDVVLDGTYKTLFTYSGSGKLMGFVLSFDGTEPQVRLTVDGDECFDLEITDVNDAQFKTGSILNGAGGPIVASSQFKFHPDFPIVYGSSVLIEALEASGKKLLRSIVTLTQET